MEIKLLVPPSEGSLEIGNNRLARLAETNPGSFPLRGDP